MSASTGLKAKRNQQTRTAILFLLLATLALQISWVLPLFGLAEMPGARHLVRMAVKWSLFVLFLGMIRSATGRLTWQELGFSNRSWRERFGQLALAAALTAPIMALFVMSPTLQSLVLQNLARHTASGPSWRAVGALPVSSGLGPGMMVGIMAVTFTAAFVEELFWRGYALAVLPARVGIFWAVTIASGLFGLTHTYLGWRAVALTFVGGIALSVLYWWRRTLLLNITIHFLFDVAGPLILLLKR